ncbi:MAG: sporulation transcriptional regulator SpoIIID [Clostridia bacterium]|nr:sporulation transcriptional regulator SpoIIID [Clostridia bacterium]
MTNNDIDNLTLDLAHFLLDNHTTIRATAKAFNMAKSTVHHILNTRLKHLNLTLYKNVKQLLQENFNIKHLHGGQATKLKYEKLKENINLNDKIEFLGI